jgi:uncharacterized membrane protein YqjE
MALVAIVALIALIALVILDANRKNQWIASSRPV